MTDILMVITAIINGGVQVNNYPVSNGMSFEMQVILYIGFVAVIVNFISNIINK